MLFLALREIRRAKLRFGLLTAAIGLLFFLILFQQALQVGLVTSFVGAIRNQSAPVLVYSVDGQRVMQAGTISPELAALVQTAPGVGAVGAIGQGTFTVLAAGEDTDATIIGYEREGLGSPTALVAGRPAETGEAVAGATTAGFDLGDTVVVQPGGLELLVVGVVADAQLSVTPTLFVNYDTYLDAVRGRHPDGAPPRPNVLGVQPADGVSDDAVVAAINAQSDELDALTRHRAAELTPGVAQVRQSFRIILGLFGLVVPLVIGLFFRIITVQKTTTLRLLRALGAPPSRLVGALAVQVVVVVGIGVAIGTALYVPLVWLDATALSLRFEPATVGGWAAVVMVSGLGAALLVARLVVAADPAAGDAGRGL